MSFRDRLDILVEDFQGIFKRSEKEDVEVYKNNEQIVPKEESDGSIEVLPSGVYSSYLDTGNRANNENQYLNLVRNLAMEPEFDSAILEIVNECVIIDEDEYPIKLDLDSLEVSDNLKKKISNEFKEVLRLLDFNQRGDKIFKQWYIDGKLYYHVIIDDKNPKKGIIELRNIDPRKIKKFKEIERGKGKEKDIIKSEKEWFLFNAKQDLYKSVDAGIKIHPDRIIYTTSGLRTPDGRVVSWLHKAVKRFNQLRLLEESVIIYRFSRAPERRVFYVGTSGMPPKKAQEQVKEVMNRFRNKVVYNQSDGTISEQKKYMSLLEDYFIPRGAEGKDTEITTIPGTTLANSLEDVEIFRKQFYLSLNVPISRLESSDGFSLGRASEISREEVKFARFCTGLRLRFSDIFDELLKRQLLLKNIVNEKDWDRVRQQVKYKYNIDNHFQELLDQEVLQSRIRILEEIEQFTPRVPNITGKYAYSWKWVQSHVLLMTDEEIEGMDKECEQEHELIAERISQESPMNYDTNGNLQQEPEQTQDNLNSIKNGN